MTPLRWRRLAVIGTGLVGGSLGLATRQRGLAERVVGFDLPGPLETAVRLGLADTAAAALVDAVRGADLIVIATPPSAAISLAAELAPHLTPGQLVTDVSGVKGPVVAAWEAARQAVGERWRFIGGHPMAGREISGPEAARADLFEGATWVLTAPGDLPERDPDLARLIAWIERLGARPTRMAAEVHDRSVAWLSHLPQMVSSALAAEVGEAVDRLAASSPGADAGAAATGRPFTAAVSARAAIREPEAAERVWALAGRGFADMTRLARSPAELWADLAGHADPELPKAVKGLADRLARLADRFHASSARAVLDAGRAARLRWEAATQSAIAPTSVHRTPVTPAEEGSTAPSANQAGMNDHDAHVPEHRAEPTGARPLRVEPARRPIRGFANVPGDKSISHRAAILGALAHGTTEVEGFLPGADCLATVACLRRLGVDVAQPTPDRLVVRGGGREAWREPGDVLDAANSGTTARLLLGALAGCAFTAVVTGDDSLRRRPMSRVTEPLARMGARFVGREGGRLLPLAVTGGPLVGLTHDLPVASAQVKSALLLAGLAAEGRTLLREPVRSRDHTERMLAAFGARLGSDGTGCWVEPGPRLEGRAVRVPGDLSSAAFLVAAALLVPGSDLTIEGVGLNPTRLGGMVLMRRMGADVTWEVEQEEAGEPVGWLRARSSPDATPGEALHGIEVDAADVPAAVDELPLIAVLAAVAAGPTVIRGASELRVKESDRIETTVAGLRAIGTEAESHPDGLTVAGREAGLPAGGSVEAHGDHRLAMAFAVAGLACPRGVLVDDARSISVSFPGFEQWLAIHAV